MAHSLLLCDSFPTGLFLRVSVWVGFQYLTFYSLKFRNIYKVKSGCYKLLTFLSAPMKSYGICRRQNYPSHIHEVNTLTSL